MSLSSKAQAASTLSWPSSRLSSVAFNTRGHRMHQHHSPRRGHGPAPLPAQAPGLSRLAFASVHLACRPSASAAQRCVGCVVALHLLVPLRRVRSTQHECVGDEGGKGKAPCKGWRSRTSHRRGSTPEQSPGKCKKENREEISKCYSRRGRPGICWCCRSTTPWRRLSEAEEADWDWEVATHRADKIWAKRDGRRGRDWGGRAGAQLEMGGRGGRPAR